MRFEEFIKGKKDFKIAFIGGSITESGNGIAYPKKVIAALNEKYPQTNFTELNASIGGTTAFLGMFRCKREVLDHNPDMFVIEYAVNGDGQPDILKYVEGVIRTSRRYNPNLPIMLMICYTSNMYNRDGENAHAYQVTVKGQEKLSKAYTLPIVYGGKKLYEAIEASNFDMDKYLNDSVHPNSDGHQIYADEFMNRLPDLEFGFDMPENTVFGVDYLHPDMDIAKNLPVPEGWKLSKRTTWYSPMPYLVTDKEGAKLSYEFEGTICGLLQRTEKDSGKMDVYLDGKFWKTVGQWDKYCNDFDRETMAVIADGLPRGKHSIDIVVRGDNEPDSEGHVIRIAAILTADSIER